jgi:hypothetical protein
MIVRVRRDAGDVHRSGGDVVEEQDVIGDESTNPLSVFQEDVAMVPRPT